MHESEPLLREPLEAGTRLGAAAERLLARGPAADGVLTRERSVVQLIAEDHSNKQVAQLYASCGKVDPVFRTQRCAKLEWSIGLDPKSGPTFGSDALGRNLKTVETHRASAMRKINVTSTVTWVRYAIRNKLVEP